VAITTKAFHEDMGRTGFFSGVLQFINEHTCTVGANGCAGSLSADEDQRAVMTGSGSFIA